MNHGQHHAFRVAQGDFAAAGRELLGEIFGYVEGDGHGPKDTAGQLHVLADAVVIGAVHEAAQRRKAAGDQQLQVAELAGGQVPGRPFFGISFEFGDTFGLSDEINEFTAVGWNEMAG